MQARLRMMLGEPEGARDSYRRILDLEPGNLEARDNLINLLVSANNTDGAKTVIEEGLLALPGNPTLLRAYLQVTLKAQGLDAALAAADRLAADPANQAVGRLLKGGVYSLAGHFADAIVAYTAEQRSQPSSALALRIAAARSAAGQPDQAAEELRWWLATHADDADAAERLAQLDLAARRFSEAKEHLQVVANKRPNDATALNNLAWIYQHSNDPRARSTALRAYLISPTPDTADTLGWILTAEGNPKKGLVLLRQAAAQHGDALSIRYHLAVALKETGQSPEALGVLQPIVQGSVSFDEKQDAAHLLDQLTKPLAIGDPQASVARQDKR
jgi:tetratricopeptide (TPR) repeat protein